MDRRCLLLVLATCAGASSASEAVIGYPSYADSDAQDPLHQYHLAVLRLALERSGAQYRLQAMRKPAGQGRAIRELSGGGSDVELLWSMTSEEREQKLLPVRIPIDRGMMGWRLLLIRRSDAERFAAIRSLEALRELTAGQLHDWPDTAILRANGLTVGTTSVYGSLFTMLSRGRLDYFPRSVLEIQDEMQLFGSAHELMIAPGLMLRYPTANYFFVNRQNQTLAADLQRGLERLLDDGTLHGLFMSHFRGRLKPLRLTERRELQLRNPLLPAATPLQRTELWADPAQFS
ncbi:MAG TPA: hypothetical protein VK195_18680 [Burkholderiaceae bacterium]|nr:hypothetical protein [Burkholderiaceae bacterium]